MSTTFPHDSKGVLRILSRSQEPFKDRRHAGQLLGNALDKYRGQRPVVLGIPRGGVAVALELARALDGELDVVLAHKLGTQGQPELAMGAVSEDGKLFLNDEVVRSFGIGRAYIEAEKGRQLAEIARRAAIIRRVAPKIPLEGRTVIVTDDGIATGATTEAALWAVRAESPRRLIAATPVGPEDTVRRIAPIADEMICLRAPPMFAAVGQFYERFEPVEDDEMLRILSDEARHRQDQSPAKDVERSNAGHNSE